MSETAPKTLDRRGLEYVKERMPMIGLGTYQVRDKDILKEVVDAALTVGYRFFDTAQIYMNEVRVVVVQNVVVREMVADKGHFQLFRSKKGLLFEQKSLGAILKELLPAHNLTREDIFITSKVSPANMAERTKTCTEVSIEELQTDYIDLMLIHWPGASRLESGDPENKKKRAETWAALEKFVEDGRIRAIGVSNYEVRHLEDLLSKCKIQPAVNQCELHPHFINPELIEYCAEKGIHFQAYSSLGSPKHVGALLEEEKVKELAKFHETTPSCVLLAWALCQGFSVLPRTTKASRVAENYKALEVKLSTEEIASLTGLNKKHRVCWNPQAVY